MDGYEVKLYFDEEGGYYVARIVEFVGCAVDAPTAEEALVKLRELKAEWIESVKSRGFPVPAPKRPLAAAA